MLTVIFFLARGCHFESANITFYGFKCIASFADGPPISAFFPIPDKSLEVSTDGIL